MIARGTWSFCIDRPLVVSFELTHSCTADCKHCDKGKIKPEPAGLLRAKDYAELRGLLKPMVVQLSGGEPLLRKDLEEIVRAVKEPSGLPYTILVTNGRLLTEEKYLALRSLGINQISISLDFPDSRHDEFRRSPGFMRTWKSWFPRSRATATTTWRSIQPSPARTFRRWLRFTRRPRSGAFLFPTAPTRLCAPGAWSITFSRSEDLALLRKTLDELLELKAKNGRIANSAWTLSGIHDFFRDGTVPGCNAGRRFMVVTPKGGLRPCSMFENEYASQKEMLKKFVPTNKCGGCYVSIRSYLDASFWTLLKDNVRTRVLSRNGSPEQC